MRSTKVTEAEPGYADGWLNVARALIQEGETDAAKPFIAEIARNGCDAGTHLLLPCADREGGRRLRCGIEVAGGGNGKVSARPRGAEPGGPASCSCSGSIKEAIDDLQKVCHGGSGRSADALHADACLPGDWRQGVSGAGSTSSSSGLRREESAQAITGKRRLASPEDNNERQAIHDHESVDLKTAEGSGSVPTASQVARQRMSKPVAIRARITGGSE